MASPFKHPPQGQQQQSSSAATKVTSMPELLENILLYVGEADVWSGHLQQYTPACKLFNLQCVNKTFRDTIQGSIKLRRLMFLEPAQENSKEADYLLSEEIKADSANLRPFWWLLEQLQDDTSVFMPQPRTYFDSHIPSITQPTITMEPTSIAPNIPNRLTSPHASWRQILTFRTPPHDFPYIIQEGSYYKSAVIFTKGHQTLGEMWDCWYAMVGMAVDDVCGYLDDGVDWCNSCFVSGRVERFSDAKDRMV